MLDVLLNLWMDFFSFCFEWSSDNYVLPFFGVVIVGIVSFGTFKMLFRWLK